MLQGPPVSGGHWAEKGILRSLVLFKSAADLHHR
jgi:hypothetical protein